MFRKLKKLTRSLFIDFLWDYIKSKALILIPAGSILTILLQILSNAVNIFSIVNTFLIWLYIFILNKDNIKQKLNSPENINNFKILLGYTKRFFDIYNFDQNKHKECFNDKTYIYYKSRSSIINGISMSYSYNKINDAYNNINKLIDKYSSENNKEIREIMLNFIFLFAVEKNKSNEEMIIIDFNKESYQQNIQNMDNYIKKLDKKL